MRNYSSTLDNRMFDFKNWYDFIAKELPNNCRIVEVGSGDGASAIYLAEAILNLGKTIDKFYLVDNMQYGKFEQFKTIFLNIANAGLLDWLDIIPMDSVKASKLFNGNSLDFVFIDSSHEYNMTKKEAKTWYSKIKDDGIISGHDVLSYENPGVGKAIYEVFPFNIKRETIDEPGHYQEFESEQFLHVMETDKNLGVWWCRKKFYFSIK
jgi:hypothetical protein